MADEYGAEAYGEGDFGFGDVDAGYGSGLYGADAYGSSTHHPVVLFGPGKRKQLRKPRKQQPITRSDDEEAAVALVLTL